MSKHQSNLSYMFEQTTTDKNASCYSSLRQYINTTFNGEYNLSNKLKNEILYEISNRQKDGYLYQYHKTEMSFFDMSLERFKYRIIKDHGDTEFNLQGLLRFIKDIRNQYSDYDFAIYLLDVINKKVGEDDAILVVTIAPVDNMHNVSKKRVDFEIRKTALDRMLNTFIHSKEDSDARGGNVRDIFTKYMEEFLGFIIADNLTTEITGGIPKKIKTTVEDILQHYTQSTESTTGQMYDITKCKLLYNISRISASRADNEVLLRTLKHKFNNIAMYFHTPTGQENPTRVEFEKRISSDDIIYRDELLRYYDEFSKYLIRNLLDCQYALKNENIVRQKRSKFIKEHPKDDNTEDAEYSVIQTLDTIAANIINKLLLKKVQGRNCFTKRYPLFLNVY